MIKLLNILNEIGDATLAVPYTNTLNDYNKKLGVSNLEYEFKIGEDTYIVSISVDQLDTTLPSNKDYEKGSTGMNIMFGLKTEKYSSGDTVRTNKGVQYQVMSTVTKILKDYIENHPELVEIAYEPTKKNAEDEAREKLYKRYAEKNLPGWQYTKDSYGYIYLKKPNAPAKSTFKRFFKK